MELPENDGIGAQFGLVEVPCFQEFDLIWFCIMRVLVIIFFFEGRFDTFWISAQV